MKTQLFGVLSKIECHWTVVAKIYHLDAAHLAVIVCVRFARKREKK